MHDQNFKNLILDYPLEALKFFAPEEAGDNLAKTRIIPIRQEQLKERLGDRFRELDVPLLVEWPDGKREAILFVLEEESQTSRFSVYRLAHYCLDLAELMKTDRVVPVVIFLNKGKRRKKLQLGGERHTYLQFQYLHCELKQLSAKEYRHSDNIVARINLPNMDYSTSEKLEIYAAAQKGLYDYEQNPEKISKYAEFIDYYADLSDQEIIEYEKQYIAKGENMGLTQKLIQQGLEEGIEKGQEIGKEIGQEIGQKKGRHQESLVLAKRLLRKKFCLIPEIESLLPQLDNQEVETLEELIEKLFDFKEATEAVDWIKHSIKDAKNPE